MPLCFIINQNNDKSSTKITWVRKCIVSSEIVKSSSWRWEGGTKSCQFTPLGKCSIHLRKGSWKIKGSIDWLKDYVGWLPSMSSQSEVWEGTSKNLEDDWQFIKGRLKDWDNKFLFKVFNVPLDSKRRLCPG